MAFKKKRLLFEPCPFCGGKTVFGLNKGFKDKPGMWELHHHPKGLCPARITAVCGHEDEPYEDAVELAYKIWSFK